MIQLAGELALLHVNCLYTSVALTKCFSKAVGTGEFLNELALAEIVPLHKEGSTTDKSNNRLH